MLSLESQDWQVKQLFCPMGTLPPYPPKWLMDMGSMQYMYMIVITHSTCTHVQYIINKSHNNYNIVIMNFPSVVIPWCKQEHVVDEGIERAQQ